MTMTDRRTTIRSTPDRSTTDRSTVELIGDLGQQASRLVRDEIWLAKQEMMQKARRAGTGAGLLGGAAVIVMYAVGAFVLAIIAGLDVAMPLWAAALVTGGILLVLAAVAGLIGRGQLRRATPAMPVETVDSVKQDVATVKDSIHGRSQ